MRSLILHIQCVFHLLYVRTFLRRDVHLPFPIVLVPFSAFPDLLAGARSPVFISPTRWLIAMYAPAGWDIVHAVGSFSPGYYRMLSQDSRGLVNTIVSTPLSRRRRRVITCFLLLSRILRQANADSRIGLSLGQTNAALFAMRMPRVATSERFSTGSALACTSRLGAVEPVLAQGDVWMSSRPSRQYVTPFFTYMSSW